MITKRLDYIKSALEHKNTVYVADLSESLRVSPVTIRKDLLLLENAGYATRFHGGAQIKRDVANFSVTKSFYDDERYIRIARLACEHIEEGDSIFLGSGRTCSVLAKMLDKFKKLSIVTNNVTALPDLTSQNHKLHLVGGEIISVDGKTYFASSHDPSQYLKNMYVTKAFTGITGIDMNAGLTVNSVISTYLYRYITGIANSWYLMADSSKFDRIALYTVEKDIGNVECYISDSICEKYTKYFDEHNIKHIV